MRVPITLFVLAFAPACADRPPITRERGHADEETAEFGTAPNQHATAPRAERATPQERTPNEAEAITPSSVTWKWRANTEEHQLFIRRRGEARCDIDGLLCAPIGQLRDRSSLFEQLDMLIQDGFGQMLPGALPGDTEGDYRGVQVVLANGESRHAHLSADLPRSVQTLISTGETLVDDPSSFIPAP